MCKNLRLLLIFIVPMLVPGSPVAAGDGNFNGVWVAWLCPTGAEIASGKCDNFVLELFQHQDRLCGTHVFATASARELDEGAAPSLTGTVQSDVATITIESNRPSSPVRLQAELKLSNNRLHWRRLENPPGHLLPAKANLIRSRHGSLLTPFFEQKLRAICTGMMALPPSPPANGGKA